MLFISENKWSEMNCNTEDRVEAWKEFKCECCFMAGEVPEEKKWTHILLAEGEEGQQCLKTVEGQVTKKEKLKQVWITFK